MIQHVKDPVYEIHDLTVTYNKKPVLWSIDLTVPQGVLCAVMGPNGAGKSTMIKATMGLLSMSSGYIELFGKSLDEVRNRVSYVPQRGSVDWDFPASVKDVVLMGRYGKLGWLKRPTKADKQVAMDCLRDVGMEEYANRQIAQLSGGQQQRVFLARALAQDADIYCMDEPFVGVDAATEDAIVTLLKRMKDKGKTVIVVHHDLQTAPKYFDWAILLNTRLIASAPIEKVFTSELLQEAYGGKLNVMSMVGNLMKQIEFPTREQSYE